MDAQRIVLRRDDAEPLYRQIAGWFGAAIARGELAAQQRLPPIRALAQSLGVSQVTVTQAYELLVRDGYVASHVGRGTFVLLPPPPPPPEPTEPPAAPPSLSSPGVPPASAIDKPPSDADTSGAWLRDWRAPRPPTARTQWDAFMREALRRVPPEPATLYLSDGVPDPALFPVSRWCQSLRLGARSLERAFAAGDVAAFQYGSALGDANLRTFLAHALAERGIQASRDEILLTSGTQQGLDLIGRTLLAPHDPLFVEEVTYLSALDLFDQQSVAWQAVPLDQDGMLVDALAQHLGGAQARPRLVYTIPTGHSPTGVTMSAARREQLVRLARERNLLLIADMVFDDFALDDTAPPPALATFAHDGRVVSLFSFNKTVFPALRLGCVVAARPLIDALAETKAIVDRGVSLPLAHALWRHLDSPLYARELAEAREHYRARRDHLLAILERGLRPLGCTWTHPSAGFSLMLTLPREYAASQVVLAAAAEGVVVLPGQVFAPVPNATWANALRLGYGSLSAGALEEAMRRLVRALRQTRQPVTRRTEERSARVAPRV